MLFRLLFFAILPTIENNLFNLLMLKMKITMRTVENCFPSRSNDSRRTETIPEWAVIDGRTCGLRSLRLFGFAFENSFGRCLLRDHLVSDRSIERGPLHDIFGNFRPKVMDVSLFFFRFASFPKLI